ncbi:GNAT family N-acetyltransferase [Fusibacter ferrireducens]|uniref:GNAT family N-acetyltransferase n=1 Tax=Fusibacter ferrireducens TaxID=2785058 RepID=A0ABR9ZPZ9_9FIRM|nr:GNAT family N-acetyltransferase [Fusibacter ferrireducens]MBF4692531.1 GNAT family N-acetyltransferase [Fusibacter ferrireducens]
MIVKAQETDRKAILEYCMDEPSINLFIIGDIELYGFDSEFQEVWIQETSGVIQGIILRYHNNFILYSKAKMNFIEILELFKAYKVDLISGKASVLNSLYPLVSDQYNFKEMNFAELSTDALLVKATSNVTIAKAEDAPDIAMAYGHIHEFENLYPGGFEGRHKQILNRIVSNEGVHMFIKENGQIVSHGNTAAETSQSAMIGGVMTLPDQRRKGYAKTVVSAICQKVINDGKRACLFYNGEAAQKLFAALGFKDIDQWVVLGGKDE